jgi:hypothetical protein
MVNESWEYRPMHGQGGFFGEEAAVMAALEKEGCGDAYGPKCEHITLRCAECDG